MELTARNIVLSAVGFFLIAILTPIGMEQIMSANTTLWETPVITIFQVVFPLMYLIGIAYGFIKDAV